MTLIDLLNYPTKLQSGWFYKFLGTRTNRSKKELGYNYTKKELQEKNKLEASRTYKMRTRRSKHKGTHDLFRGSVNTTKVSLLPR